MRKWFLMITMFISVLWVSNSFAAGSAIFVGDNQILITGAVVDGDDFDVFTDLGLTPGKDVIKIKKIVWYGAAIVLNDVCELEIDDTHPISPILNAVVAGQPHMTPNINISVNKLYVDQLDHGSCCIVYESDKPLNN